MDELRQRERRSHDAEMSSPRCQRSKMNRCSTLGKIRKRRPVPLSSSGRKNIGSPTAAVPPSSPDTDDWLLMNVVLVPYLTSQCLINVQYECRPAGATCHVVEFMCTLQLATSTSVSNT